MGDRPITGVPPQSQRGLPDDASSRLGGRAPTYPLIDEDGRVSRTISRTSPEFRAAYVDDHIKSVEYWSTAHASESAKLREFRVHYRDGRSRMFRLDEIAVRRPSMTAGTTRVFPVRAAMDPVSYVKRGGFILPNRFDASTTPKLVDIATTIAHNHGQRERFLEIAKTTFEFGVILTYYAAPPQTPNLMRTQGKLVRSPLLDAPPPPPLREAESVRFGKAEPAPNKPLRESYQGATPEAERAILAGQAAEDVYGVVVGTEKNTRTFTVRFIDPKTGKANIVNVIPDFMPTIEKNSSGFFKSAKNPSEAVLIADSKFKWGDGKNVVLDDQIRAMLVLAARAKKPFVFLLRMGGGISKGIADFASSVGAEIQVVTSPMVR